MSILTGDGPQGLPPFCTDPCDHAVECSIMQAQAPAIAVEELTVRLPTGIGWRRRTVLDRVCFQLPVGQFLGLLGPNGSGKSTLLRHLAGVLRPTSGRVALFGNSAQSAAAFQSVTFLPEDSPFPRDLRAMEALALLASLRGRSGASSLRQRQAALDRAGLGPHSKTPLGRFSRGMLRRFGLAQAFLFEPQLVLLDEPTAGLDAPGWQLLQEYLREHKQRGGSLVLCSHQVDDLVQHADQVIVLWQGRLVRRGTAQEQLANAGRRRMAWSEGVEAEAAASWLRNAGARNVDAGAEWRALADLYREISDETSQGFPSPSNHS